MPEKSAWRRMSAAERWFRLIVGTLLFGVAAWIFGGTWMETVCLVLMGLGFLACVREALWERRHRRMEYEIGSKNPGN